MSVQAGMEAGRFRDTALGAFFSGDTDTISDLARSINHTALPDGYSEVRVQNREQ
jgi:hypothetical protein